MLSSFQVTVLSLFPEMFPGVLQYSLAGLGLKNNLWSLETINIRDFGLGRVRQVDDQQYGGGPGLVMRPDVLADALDYAIKRKNPKQLYYLSPRGKIFKQDLAHEIIAQENILLLCGRFEGIDERVIEEYKIIEISLGDFVLSGGEVAALAILDTCVRLLPGIVSNRESLQEDSFSNEGINNGLLEYPIYTRPAIWRNRPVPEVLLSGHHQKIKNWRYKQAVKLTEERRPELLLKHNSNS